MPDSVGAYTCEVSRHCAIWTNEDLWSENGQAVSGFDRTCTLHASSDTLCKENSPKNGIAQASTQTTTTKVERMIRRHQMLPTFIPLLIPIASNMSTVTPGRQSHIRFCATNQTSRVQVTLLGKKHHVLGRGVDRWRHCVLGKKSLVRVAKITLIDKELDWHTTDFRRQASVVPCLSFEASFQCHTVQRKTTTLADASF